MKGVDETQRALNREIHELNSKYKSPAKAIILKDKVYLVGLEQENSKELTLQQVLRVVECTYRAQNPVHRTSALLGINNPINSEAAATTSAAEVDKNEATIPGIGFAFLLLFANGKKSLPLAQYMGKHNQASSDMLRNLCYHRNQLITVPVSSRTLALELVTLPSTVPRKKYGRRRRP